MLDVELQRHHRHHRCFENHMIFLLVQRMDHKVHFLNQVLDTLNILHQQQVLNLDH